jgi:hypothetical protein
MRFHVYLDQLSFYHHLQVTQRMRQAATPIHSG